jgi:hypothetical protein
MGERCEVLIAVAPPLARTTLGKLVTGVVSEAALINQVRQRAPQTDALMLANVSGRSCCMAPISTRPAWWWA